MSINEDCDLLLKQAWREIELRESMVAPTPFDGPVQVEETHTNPVLDLIGQGKEIADNEEFDDNTKVQFLKDILRRIEEVASKK